MKKEEPTFWVTNISNMNVSLADLNLTVKAFSSVNLLDKKHYYYTQEQLTKSFESGSIHKKRDKIIVRKVAPEILKANVPLTRETFIPTRERSLLAIKEENYEELNLSEEDQKKSDEMFAKENADTADADTKPMIQKV
jgi:hypothetical protein